MHIHQTLNARGQIIDLSKPVVMGILNITPDSFYDGGMYTSVQQAVDHCGRMLSEGASIIDVGGMSSRPGAEIISPGIETDRVKPVIEALLRAFPELCISIDTLHGQTAREALASGASIVNDISGGRYDPTIIEVAAKFGAPFICMHMRGLPADMQKDPRYENVTQEVLDFFSERIKVFREAGVTDIVLDPGFGFGKTVDHNYSLLARLGVFHILECPLLVGISRKSMITRVLNVKPTEALGGTIALHILALQRGAAILRVHDVKEAAEVIAIYEKFAAVGGDERLFHVPSS